MNVIKLFAAVIGVSCLASPSSYASPVSIESMFVDSATVSLSINRMNLFSRTINLPSPEITMGEYQSSIALFGTGWGSSLNIYTTGMYGAPAPSGYVDGTTISVDLSSIRAVFDSRLFDFDVGLWPLNTPQHSGVYDPLTGRYVLDWRYNFMVDNPGVRCDYSGSFMVRLQGSLATSAVPVPAAVWLFGSGLFMLAGFVRSKNNLDG